MFRIILSNRHPNLGRHRLSQYLIFTAPVVLFNYKLANLIGKRDKYSYQPSPNNKIGILNVDRNYKQQQICFSLHSTHNNIRTLYYFIQPFIDREKKKPPFISVIHINNMRVLKHPPVRPHQDPIIKFKCDVLIINV